MATEILVSLIIRAVIIPISGLLLMLSAKIFKLADQSFKTAIKISLILGLAGFVFDIVAYFMKDIAFMISTFIISILSWISISILAAVLLIKNQYALDWGKSLLVWLVWFAFSLVALFIVSFVIGIILVAIGLTAYAQGGLSGI